MNVLQELQTLSKNAYAPYSKFNVAALVVMNGGEVFKGVNVENAAFPLTNCAEKNAISAAVTSGYKPLDFAEIHLYANEGEKVILPCGSCRQFIFEMFGPSKKIYAYSNNEIKEFSVIDLLPSPFSDKDL